MASGGSRGLRWSPKVLQNAACAHAPSLGWRGECVEPQNATVSSSIMDSLLSPLREKQKRVEKSRVSPARCPRPRRRAGLHLLS